MLRNTALSCALLFAAAQPSAASSVLLFEDFEDASVTYTTSVAEFTDGEGDFFIRTDGTDIASSLRYSNIQGTSFFAAMDADGEGASLPVMMEFSGIDISGTTGLQFSAFFAEDDGPGENWDSGDFLRIEYRIDSGGFENLFAVENDGTAFNSAPFVDADFDGNGDGAEITDVFTQHVAAIAGTGTTLDLRFIISLNAGEEDIAFDNVLIEGTAVPLPAAASMLAPAVLLLLCTARLPGKYSSSRRRRGTALQRSEA